MINKLAQIIENAFEKRSEINLTTQGEIRDAVNQTLTLLDHGEIRICEKKNDIWQVNQWIKKAILLSFRLNDNFVSKYAAVSGNDSSYFDKVPLKFANWTEKDFREAGFRAPIKQSSSIITGLACKGSRTPPIPAPPEI